MDISDLSRYYSPVKWHKLSQSTRTVLISNPKRISEKNKRDSSSTNRNTVAATTTSDSQSDWAVTIDAFIKVIQHMYPPCIISGVDRLPDNGSNSGGAINVKDVAAYCLLCAYQWRGLGGINSIFSVLESGKRS